MVTNIKIKAKTLRKLTFITSKIHIGIMAKTTISIFQYLEYQFVFSSLVHLHSAPVVNNTNVLIFRLADKCTNDVSVEITPLTCLITSILFSLI